MNKMFLDKKAIDSHRGYFLIFNYDEFKDISHYPKITSAHDVNRLYKTFTELGFTVRVYHNLTSEETRKIIDLYSWADLANCDMIGVAIITRGDCDGVLYTRDSQLDISDYTEPFKLNSTLIGKPKVLHISLYLFAFLR